MNIRYAIVLLCLCFASIAHAQQIPNGSFEDWDANGNPVGWGTTNNPDAVSPIMKSTMHVDGQFSVEGRVMDFLGFPYPPVLFSGSEDVTGFPIHARPEALKGYIAGQVASGESVVVTIGVGNTDNLIGGGAYSMTSTQAGLTAFSIPITYIMPGNADSAWITVNFATTTQLTVGSVFYIDDLEFGSSTGSVKHEGEPTDFTVTHSARYNEISFAAAGAAYTSLEILDVHGKTIETLYTGITDQLRIRWEGRGLANGMYFARLIRPEGIEIKKVILTR